MCTLLIPPDLEMFYVVDDYTEPWREAETILLLHGNSESSAAWYAWIPVLARHFRIVRPDMRGFGSSTPMPKDFPWTLDVLIDDYIRLMDALGIRHFHLAGAKIGGVIARALAARRAERVRTLTVVGSQPPVREGEETSTRALIEEFEKYGVEHWARRTMKARLGSNFPPDGIEWWTRFMGRTAVSSQLGFMATIPSSDIRADVARIKCPTLIITEQENPIYSVEQVREGQQMIRNSKLLVLPGASHHVAASYPEKCALAIVEFITANTAV